MTHSVSASVSAIFLLVLAALPGESSAQIVPIFETASPPGVMLDADGMVRAREVDPSRQLAEQRARAKAARESAKDGRLTYVSLPRLFEQVKRLRAAGQPVPDSLRYLGGLTQIRFVFLFPEKKDLVIAGSAEPWRALPSQGDSVQYVTGTRTGRPVMQLDDLIVALRTASEGGGKVFGCGIYPSPDSVKVAEEVERKLARASRAERVKALAAALGPQEVRIFGTRNDTRFAYICVAADYELKRLAMGLDRAPVPGVGNGVDHSRSAANKFWFAASYAPLRVSAEGDAYEISGPRLQVQAGQFDFDPRGATDKAKTFAEQFTRHMPDMAAVVPTVAELQNIADEALLANLIRRYRLAEKIDWDMQWVMDQRQCPVATVPVPRTAQTLSGFTGGSIVAGGVTLMMSPFLDNGARQTGDASLSDRGKSAKALRDSLPDAAAPVFADR